MKPVLLLLAVILGLLMFPSESSADPLSKKISGRVAEGALEESLETLSSPQNRQRMEVITHNFVSALVVGAFDGLKQAANQGKLPSFLPSSRTMARNMDRYLAPAIDRLIKRILKSTLDVTLSEDNQARIETLIEGIMHSAVRGLAKGLEQDLGPALAKMLEQDMIPAVMRSIESPQTQSAIATTMQTLTKNSVVGTERGMDKIAAENEAEGETSALELFGGRVAIGYAIALFLAFTFATLFIVMTVLLVRSNRRQRDMIEDVRRREQLLMVLLESEHKDRGEIAARMRKELENGAEAP